MPAVSPADRRRTPAIAAIVDLLEPALRDDRGQWSVDYVRLRFKATKSA